MFETAPVGLRRYWPVGLIVALGLGVSGWFGRTLDREARRLDQARFEVEAQIAAAFLEKKMERYEERLGRLADYCSTGKELHHRVWDFRQGAMTDLEGNLPSVAAALVAPKMAASNLLAHIARAKEVHPGYDFRGETNEARPLALPVWEKWVRKGYAAIPLGTDLATLLRGESALTNALGNMRWISPGPERISREDGGAETGFWFVNTIYPAALRQINPWSKSDEPVAERTQRHLEFRVANAAGILAVFIPGRLLVDSAFNIADGEMNGRPAPRLHLQLYAGPEATAGKLLNPGSEPPAQPRHRKTLTQLWYGRRWTVEVASLPRFEADSLLYRSRMALAAGCGMTLLAAVLAAVFLRAHQREREMSAETLEAHQALVAAAQEREKLGHDLHDGAIQSLYGIQLGLTKTVEAVEASDAESGRVLREARHGVDEVIAELRGFISMRPRAGETERAAIGLETVLSSMIERLQPTTTAALRLKVEPNALAGLPAAQALELTQIARTALANALRHARARNIEVAVRRDDKELAMEIGDDGVGFDSTREFEGRMGLRTMKARARAAGGTAEVVSAPGKGAKVLVRLPV